MRYMIYCLFDHLRRLSNPTYEAIDLDLTKEETKTIKKAAKELHMSMPEFFEYALQEFMNDKRQ